jgi:phosphoenolpyruvate carboxykinase (ATP)
LSKALFTKYWEKSQDTACISKSYCVGQSPYQIQFALESSLHWHQAFAACLFHSPNKHSSTWTVRCLPNYHPSSQHPEIVAICFSERKILIAGTAYAGEIKKAMFTVMNYLLPKNDVLTLHCSATLNQLGESSLMLGLSGTGKTSLSANAHQLIGDDEHAWTPTGVLNLENGCYAKCAYLSHANEPDVVDAIHQGSILENVVIKNDDVNFNNLSITENIRAAYPLRHIKNAHEGLAPHPKHIIFLCCDSFGVIPPLSKLSISQAQSFFLTGYTAKVGSTEAKSHKAIEPISSPCFGQPFFPLDKSIYADLLAKKIDQHQCQVWLVNTGWTNGDANTKERIPLAHSKALIDAIINHRIQASDLELNTDLNLMQAHSIMQQSHPSLYTDTTWTKSTLYTTNLKKVKTFLSKNTYGEKA